MSACSDSLPGMRSTPALRILLAVCLTLALLATTASASGESTAVIHFQSETLPALKAQLGKHEVHALTFHPTPAPGHIHASMNDGKHYTVVYNASEQTHLIALASADGTPYAVATVKPKPAAKTHHTLRYIAAGIVIVVIIVVAAVLLVDRRRKLGEGAGETPAPGDSAT